MLIMDAHGGSCEIDDWSTGRLIIRGVSAITININQDNNYVAGLNNGHSSMSLCLHENVTYVICGTISLRPTIL